MFSLKQLQNQINNTMKTEYILLIFYSLFSIMNIYVFIFQRTIRKISMYYNLRKVDSIFLYPKALLLMYNISKIRYLILIVMFYFSWWLAILSGIIKFLIQISIPVSDYNNIQIVKKLLSKKDKNPYTENLMIVVLDAEKKTI